MLLPALATVSGFVFLVWGAERFVVGSAATARGLGLSPLFVGLTVVAVGTSAPEVLVSVIASLGGNPGLAIGNALGSNITNCALVLGAAALIAPVTFRSVTIRNEFPVLAGLMLCAWLLMRDGEFSRFGGALLVAGIAPLVWWMYWVGGHVRGDEAMAAEFEAEVPRLPLARSLTWLAVGLATLLVASRAVVWGAVEIATALGVSDTVIGLSIVAIGTSLPELAASVTAALKGEHDIAVGNVLGSNMFNLLAVLGLAGLLAPGRFEPEVLSRDFPVMLATTLAVAALAFMRRGPPTLGRGPGLVLLLAFVCYQWLLYD